MPTGYSGTPLTKKLGIKPSSRVCLIRVPERIEVDIALVQGQLVKQGSADVIVALFPTKKQLAESIEELSKRIFPNGAIWIGWPKKSSKVQTDIVEQVVRDICLPLGLVDNKVCAIDETWSEIRIVWRIEQRNRR